MSRQEPIYIKNENSGVRNKDIFNVSTSSDLCIFVPPSYDMSGAIKVPYSGFSGTSGIYIISGDTDIDLTFNFTGNTSVFSDSDFKFEIYPFVKNANEFNKQPIYQSSDYKWESFSGTSAITETISTSTLTLDNDFLIKGHYIYTACTEFMGYLGKIVDTSNNKGGDDFGIYNSATDYFFVVINEADIPIFDTVGSFDSLGTLKVVSFIPENNSTVFSIFTDVGDTLILSLNGLTLADGYDYNLNTTSTGSTIVLSEPTINGDIITYAYVGDGNQTNRVYHDIYDIQSPIISGVTNAEGGEEVYFNTDTGKYEVFTTVIPRNRDDIYIALNGVTLANGIDYYQSVTNPKRIIFEGVIEINDILGIYYAVFPDTVGGISDINQTIGWGITTPPSLENGVFTLEISSDELFTTMITSAQTNYIIGRLNYSVDITVNGSVGTTYYYRVKNEKNYESINGYIINTTAYSEIIPIVVETNSINSY